MTLVVDASVAIKWYLDEPHADALALVARRQVELVTADRRLFRRVQAGPVPVRIRLLVPAAELA